jgi:DNA transformation protein and related proteins
LPARLFDEPEELGDWARAALAAAQRAALHKRAKAKTASKPAKTKSAETVVETAPAKKKSKRKKTSS